MVVVKRMGQRIQTFVKLRLRNTVIREIVSKSNASPLRGIFCRFQLTLSRLLFYTSGVQGPGVPGFQPQAYPGYNQGQHSFRPPGLYNPNTRAPNGAPPPYYGQPSSVMVSPGGGSYMRPPSNYYHGGGGEYEQHQHPGYGQYQNHRYPHPMYGSEMHNRPPTYEPPRSQQQTTLPPQNGMDFSRAVSSSFGESNSKSSADKMRHERESSDSLRNFSNQYKGDDDRSVASKADSDTSWKLLNQVASIEEEKFRNAEAGRTGTTSPIGGRTSNTNHEQNKIVSMPTPSKMASLTSLSSVASEQEPLDTSNSKDELDLIQCASSGSLLFNTNDDSFTKRPREERGDAEEEPRGGGDDEIRRPPSSSPPNVASLSMQEKDAARPPKKRRGPNTDDYYDNAPSYSFSLESATSFSRDQQFGSLPALTEKPRQSSFLAPFGNQKEKSDTNRCDMLASSNLLWDIKGQDSFGGALSVGSNISGNGGDGPVITSSFSFGKESNADPEIKEDPTDNDSVSKLPEYGRTISENHSTDFGNIKCENTDDAPRGSRSDSIDVNRNPDPNARAQMGQFPHQSSNWINNAASFNREQPDAHHGQRHPSSHPPGLYAPNQNGPSRSFSSTSLPPQRIHPGQKHAHDMMRNYSQDSGQSNPSAPGQMPPMSRYGPLHGPYGVPLPPHIPQSDAHLPPSFRPPHPPMQSHGHMNRQPPPQAVYVMSTPPGGRPGMNRHTSADESVMSKAAGGVYSWTKQDDARLTEIMKKFKNPKDWEPIAKEFGRGKRYVLIPVVCLMYFELFLHSYLLSLPVL